MDRRGRREINRTIREARETLNRELEAQRRKYDAKIAEIRQESKRREAELNDAQRKLSEQQAMDVRRMQTEVKASIERQRAENRRELEIVRREAETRIRELNESFREKWEQAYRELDERINRQYNRIQEITDNEREHAEYEIASAKEKLNAAQADAVLAEFGEGAASRLVELFNAAVADYNAGNYVPADGKAAMTAMECDRCLEDARQRRNNWEAILKPVLKRLEELEALLQDMLIPTDIEAAGSEIHSICLRDWNQEGYSRCESALQDQRTRLSLSPHCTVETIAASNVEMEYIGEAIRAERQKAQDEVVRYLYIDCLADCAAEKLEEQTAYRCVERSAAESDRTVDWILSRGSDGTQRLRLNVCPAANDGQIRLTVSHGGYDESSVRQRQLHTLSATLAVTLSGEDWPLMRALRQWDYRDGEAICMGIDFSIPQEAMSAEPLFGPAERSSKEGTEEINKPGDNMKPGQKRGGIDIE